MLNFLFNILIGIKPSPYDAMTTDQARQEAYLLLRERQHLMQKLNQTNRNLERRAEGIKFFFAADAKKAELREARMMRQLSELTSRIEDTSRRCHEAEAARRDVSEKSELKIQGLEEELVRLRSQLSKQKTDELLQFESNIQSERAKYNRLDSEHKVLRKELTKIEVRNRALARDIVKLQASTTSSLEDAMKAISAKERCETELGELKRERSELFTEINALREALAKTERQAENSNLNLQKSLQEESVSQMDSGSHDKNDMPTVDHFINPSSSEENSVQYISSLNIPKEFVSEYGSAVDDLTCGMKAERVAEPHSQNLRHGVLEDKLEKLSALADRLLSARTVK